MDNSDRMHPAQVAQRYGITPETLSNWRREGKGPRWVKLGNGKRPRVMYRTADVLKWEQQNLTDIGGNT